MNILIIGAAGFIGTNLAIKLAQDDKNTITVVDKDESYFLNIDKYGFSNIRKVESSMDISMDYGIFENQDIVYHLVSTNMPTNSNQHISSDIENNVLFSSKVFDACVKYSVKKVVFISSGGTVYGLESCCPLCEDTPTNPISSYGLQKVFIEKLLYLYHYMYGLDYRIVRLANPYGPYQRPNGVLGAVTTFTYKALRDEKIEVYGDGSVIRDFIYIDDAISGIENIVNKESSYRIFNLGSGYGTSINELLDIISRVLNKELKIVYKDKRQVDVPVNYLDISRYESCFGKLNPLSLEDGIRRTAVFLEENYK